MSSPRYRLAAVALGAALVVGGCFPGPERVGELTLATMQGRFRSDPQLKASGAEVVSVKVTGGSRTRYAAIASIRHGDKTYDVPVTVVLDGFNLEWFAEPTAFDFLPKAKPPASAEQIPR